MRIEMTKEQLREFATQLLVFSQTQNLPDHVFFILDCEDKSGYLEVFSSDLTNINAVVLEKDGIVTTGP